MSFDKRGAPICGVALVFALLILMIGDAAGATGPSGTVPGGVATGSKSKSRSARGRSPAWYFAFSGDSRDCGDAIMPKIANSIRQSKPPVAFYWHLGDFRRMFQIDCDIIKRQFPDYDCKTRPPGVLAPDAFSNYAGTAWDDFIDHQLRPFGDLPVFLGIGNHELYAKKTRDDYRQKFQPWLMQKAIQDQRTKDAANGITANSGDTYYHFVKNGVDFIALDNADQKSFNPAQVEWLIHVLEQDNKDPSIRAIIAGMHEALPFSRASSHAMDASCQGICSGQQVYDLLYRSHSIYHKHVYVFSSHAHYFRKAIYNTPEHQGRVLPGWIVGTAGAEQYQQTIGYGYLLVGVRRDGSIRTKYKGVTRESPPSASGPGADELTDYCFTKNKVPPDKLPNDATKKPCVCGAVETVTK